MMTVRKSMQWSHFYMTPLSRASALSVTEKQNGYEGWHFHRYEVYTSLYNAIAIFPISG